MLEKDYYKITEPTIIVFPKIGMSSLGYISPAENENLPFDVKRIYWTYYTPENVERGGHSHKNLRQILVAVAGTITVTTELLNGQKNIFVLDCPNKGLFIPKLCWREMKYTHNAVQMCIASMEYNEADYIRSYDDFKAQLIP
jgi:hypothetical protein